MESKPEATPVAPPIVEENLFAEVKASLISEVRKEIKDEFSRKGLGKNYAIPKEDDRSFAEWICLVGKAAMNGREREDSINVLNNKYAQADLNKKTMTQGSTTAGGYTVPYFFVNDLLSVEGYQGVCRPRVNEIQCNSNQLVIPILDQTITPSGGNSAFTAGVNMAVVSEGSAASSVQPAFKQLVINMIKHMAYTQISTELLTNSALAVAKLVTDQFQAAIANVIDYNVLVGTGWTSSAIVGHAATITVPRATASEFALVDAAKMYRRLPAASKAKAVWIMHPYMIDQLVSLADAQGRAVWLPNQSASGGFQMSLFGLPVLTTEFSPALNSTGDVLLVDLSHYILGINSDVSIQSSIDYAFTSDLVTYRASLRAAGKPGLTAPVILNDGTSSVSPFIALTDAA